MVSLDLYLLSSRYLSDISLELSVKQLCEFKLKGKRVPARNVYIWELSACHLYLKSELMSPLRERTEMEEATLWRTTERSVKEANWKGSERSQEDRDQQLKGKGKVRCLGSQRYWGMMAQEGSKERTNWKDLKVGISNLELLRVPTSSGTILPIASQRGHFQIPSFLLPSLCYLSFIVN